MQSTKSSWQPCYELSQLYSHRNTENGIHLSLTKIPKNKKRRYICDKYPITEKTYNISTFFNIENLYYM